VAEERKRGKQSLRQWPTYVWGEPVVSYRWISWSSRLMGILTKMSQLGHYEIDGNVHWERGSQVNTCELPSLTRFRTRGRSSR
jgi:hypothetical protein